MPTSVHSTCPRITCVRCALTFFSPFLCVFIVRPSDKRRGSERTMGNADVVAENEKQQRLFEMQKSRFACKSLSVGCGHWHMGAIAVRHTTCVACTCEFYHFWTCSTTRKRTLGEGIPDVSRLLGGRKWDAHTNLCAMPQLSWRWGSINLPE